MRKVCYYEPQSRKHIVSLFAWNPAFTISYAGLERLFLSQSTRMAFLFSSFDLHVRYDRITESLHLYMPRICVVAMRPSYTIAPSIHVQGQAMQGQSCSQHRNILWAPRHYTIRTSLPLDLMQFGILWLKTACLHSQLVRSVNHVLCGFPKIVLAITFNRNID